MPMAYCKYCGSEIADNQSDCPSCGLSAQPQNNHQQNYTQPTVLEDKKSPLLNVLSFFMPIIGIIFYFITEKDTPIKAKSALKSAIASIILTCISIVLCCVIPILLVLGVADDESISLSYSLTPDYKIEESTTIDDYDNDLDFSVENGSYTTIMNGKETYVDEEGETHVYEGEEFERRQSIRNDLDEIEDELENLIEEQYGNLSSEIQYEKLDEELDKMVKSGRIDKYERSDSKVVLYKDDVEEWYLIFLL